MSPTKIRYLDGTRLKRALIAGARRVIEFRDQLNAINVFPVADSDTGTNMAGTLRSVLTALVPVSDRSIAVVTRAAADSALSGARGNSGAILAQFFHGMAEELKDAATVDIGRFGSAVRNAVSYAYSAISTPVEGTILTVLRSWADRFHDACRRSVDFAHAVMDSLSEARTSLGATKQRLPVLEKAGVVDAGALGFVQLIEGIAAFITRGRIREMEQSEDAPPAAEEPAIISADTEITHRFCTECILEGERIDHSLLRSELSRLGDSIILAGSARKSRIHIHTDEPSDVFAAASKHGVVADQKADDMRKQFAAAHARTQRVALVVDSACDMPQDLSTLDFVHVVPLQVMFGDRHYLDKVGLKPSQFHALLRAHPTVVPRTSQPTSQEYEKLFAFLLSYYDEVVTIAVSGALSGTLSAARTAAERLTAMRSNDGSAETPALRPPVADRAGDPRKCRSGVGLATIDSRNVSVAIGLIVRRLVEALQQGADGQRLIALGEALAARTRILFTAPSVEAMVRSGRVSRLKGRVAALLDLKPIVTITADGRAVAAGTARGVDSGQRKIVQMISQSIQKNRPTDFAIAHVNNPEGAQWFEREIRSGFSVERPIFIQDATPVLAAHTGFGTVAVAWIDPD